MKLATIAYCSLGALLYSVVMIQIGEAVQRGRAVTPVTLHAKCPPPEVVKIPSAQCYSNVVFKDGDWECDDRDGQRVRKIPMTVTEPCYFTDDAGREMHVRVQNNIATPYLATPEPRVKNNAWSVP